jgi:DnaK suppressor protein
MSETYNLHAIKQNLQVQRTTLLERLENNNNSEQTVDLLNPDQDDRAMIYRDKNRKSLLLDHDRQQLHDIDQAIARIETGTYGICSTCGQKISHERLEILPTAALCIDCQRTHDKGAM